MKRFLLPVLLALASVSGTALARPVAVQGQVLSPPVETLVLPGGSEGLAVAALPRLGLIVENRPNFLRLRLGAAELRYSAPTGWTAGGILRLARPLPAPEATQVGLYLPLEVLGALGLSVLADSPEVLDLGPPVLGRPVAIVPAPAPPGTSSAPMPSAPMPSAPMPSAPAPLPPLSPPGPAPRPAPSPKPGTATPSPPPALGSPTPLPPAPGTPAQAAPPLRPPPAMPPPVVQPPVVSSPGARLLTLRSSRSLTRSLERQRVVLEFAGTAAFQITRDKSGLSVALPGVAPAPDLSANQTLESGDTLSVTPAPGGLIARLDTGGGHSDVFTLHNPYRIVIDTATNLDPSVPPPPDFEHLPVGVTHRQLGQLHLLAFDPARYQARVVSAPYGESGGVADFVARAGGVAGVNGGYFDPASALPVDLVAQGGQMLSPSLERRATLGLDEGGRAQLGYPRPRYVLSGDWGSATVNTVTARPNPAQLTAFVGDGRTPVGGAGLITLVLAGGQVARVAAGQSVPAPAELSVTFDPARFPNLPRTPGNPLTLTLDWRVSGWDTTREALAAGPLLVQGGQYALNPAREGFNTAASIWRPTRQVAFALVGGQPAVAYLEYGTPEEFARALIAAGVGDAMRLDSGSSATVFVAGGYTGSGGYLNTVYSRTVPNAIVFVPRGQLGVRK